MEFHKILIISIFILFALNIIRHQTEALKCYEDEQERLISMTETSAEEIKNVSLNKVSIRECFTGNEYCITLFDCPLPEKVQKITGINKTDLRGCSYKFLLDYDEEQVLRSSYKCGRTQLCTTDLCNDAGLIENVSTTKDQTENATTVRTPPVLTDATTGSSTITSTLDANNSTTIPNSSTITLISAKDNSTTISSTPTTPVMSVTPTQINETDTDTSAMATVAILLALFCMFALCALVY